MQKYNRKHDWNWEHKRLIHENTKEIWSVQSAKDCLELAWIIMKLLLFFNFSVKSVITHFNNCTWQGTGHKILNFNGILKNTIIIQVLQITKTAPNHFFITSPADKSDPCVWQCSPFNSKWASWQQKNVIHSAANFNIHSLADSFFGNITEVMLNKTCGSLKVINRSLEFGTTVSTLGQSNPDFTQSSCFLIVS